MFKLNLIHFNNFKVYDNYSEFLICEQCEKGKPLQIKQQKQLDRFITTHKEISKILKIFNGTHFTDCHHYSRDSKFLTEKRDQILETIEIRNIEDQKIVPIKIKNQVDQCIEFSSDNTTLLLISNQNNITTIKFYDLRNINIQEIHFKNRKFMTFWKKDNKIYILLKNENKLQLYTMSLFEDQKPLLQIERMIDLYRYIEEFFSQIDEFCFIIQLGDSSKICYKQNLKTITTLKSAGPIFKIKMLVKSVLLISYDLFFDAIQVRQTWSHKSIRRKFLKVQSLTRSFIYNTMFVSLYSIGKYQVQFCFYDIFEGEDVLMIDISFEQKIDEQQLEKIFQAYKQNSMI